MTPGQGKAGLLVLRKRVSGRSEGMHRVAVLATVVIGRSRELPLVDVRVAILAGRQLDLVDRVQFEGKVAFGARDAGVLSLQWVSGRRMLLYSIGSRLPTIHRVARLAGAAILPCGELRVMRVWMAVQTPVEGQRPLEVPAFMAHLAARVAVFSQ